MHTHSQSPPPPRLTLSVPFSVTTQSPALVPAFGFFFFFLCRPSDCTPFFFLASRHSFLCVMSSVECVLHIHASCECCCDVYVCVDSGSTRLCSSETRASESTRWHAASQLVPDVLTTHTNRRAILTVLRCGMGTTTGQRAHTVCPATSGDCCAAIRLFLHVQTQHLHHWWHDMHRKNGRSCRMARK